MTQTWAEHQAQAVMESLGRIGVGCTCRATTCQQKQSEARKRVGAALSLAREGALAECKRIANDCLQTHSPIRDEEMEGEIIAHGNSAGCIYSSIEALEVEPSDPTKKK